MKYNVVVEKRAAKFIRKQQPAQQKRILEALAQLPFIGDIKPMAGMSGFYRLRVGMLELPPLGSRPEDILLLSRCFID